MNRSEIVDQLAASGTPRDEVNHIVIALFDEITAALVRGETVSIRGFGAFEPRQRQLTGLRHPTSRQPIDRAVTATVSLRPAESLKARLNAK